MSNDPSREMIEQAVQAIQTGRFEEAREHLNRALALSPDNPEALLLQGVALSKLGQSEDATESFRKSIQLNPSNPKTFYNFSVHYYSIGQKEQALEMAREAVRLDPSHQGANDLIRRIESETGTVHTPSPQQPFTPLPTPEGTPSGPFQAPPMGAYYRGNYYEGPAPHGLKFVEQMGPAWTGTGWVLVLLSFLRTVLAVVTFPIMYEYFQKAFSNPSARPAPPDLGVYGHPVIVIAGWMIVVAGLLWMIFDIIDRRGSWIWFVFNCILCCITLNWILLLAYMMAGRKNVS